MSTLVSAPGVGRSLPSDRPRDPARALSASPSGTLGPMLLRQFVIDGLGHLSTLIADESAGLAAVVDPRRDVDVYLEAARDGRPPDQPRRRDAPPQRLRLRRPRARRADRGDATSSARARSSRTSTGRSATATRSTSVRSASRRSRRRATRRSTSPTPSPTRSRADEPLLLFTGGSLLVGAVGPDGPSRARNTRSRTRARCSARIREVILPHEDFVGRLPDPRRGLALLDRHLVDAVVDDRLRAPPQPDGPARPTSTGSPSSC